MGWSDLKAFLPDAVSGSASAPALVPAAALPLAALPLTALVGFELLGLVAVLTEVLALAEGDRGRGGEGASVT